MALQGTMSVGYLNFDTYIYRFIGNRTWLSKDQSTTWTLLDGPSPEIPIVTHHGEVQAVEYPLRWQLVAGSWVVDHKHLPFAPIPRPLDPVNESTGRSLWLTLQEQPDQDQMHWALFLAEEGARGTVYQATGDHQYMTIKPRDGIEIFNSNSYRTSYTIISDMTIAGEAFLRRAANEVLPPSAPSVREIKGDCQTWCVDVLRYMHVHGNKMVSQAKLDMVQGMVERKYKK